MTSTFFFVLDFADSKCCMLSRSVIVVAVKGHQKCDKAEHNYLCIIARVMVQFLSLSVSQAHRQSCKGCHQHGFIQLPWLC